MNSIFKGFLNPFTTARTFDTGSQANGQNLFDGSDSPSGNSTRLCNSCFVTRCSLRSSSSWGGLLPSALLLAALLPSALLLDITLDIANRLCGIRIART